jgi:23S rRNA pseudouridine1911/1915/1917 synthase
LEPGERLDRVVQAALPELSRTAVQRLIEGGGVRVNGRPQRAGYRLRAGEQVEWDPLPPPAAPAGPAAEAIPLEVVFEDEHLLVIDKPRGLVVHPAPGHAAGTLVNAVLAHAEEDLTGIGGVERPGIVHRLDKDTTGLMVVAKTEPAFHSLQAQIAARSVERRYLALVRGAPRFERAVVDAPIGRHPTDRKRMAVLRAGSGREAVTDLRVLERFPGFALLEARLQTGRTHQIRVHCAYIRLPVAGDEVYGPRRVAKDPHLSAALRAALSHLGGQALHAHRLAFAHPATGERLQWQAPPPADFGAVLTALGSTWTASASDPWPEGEGGEAGAGNHSG